MGGSSSGERAAKQPFIFGECLTYAILFISAFAFNFGMTLWVTFVAGIVMYKNLPLHTFGHIQSKLFPLYFLIEAVTSFIMLAVAAYSARNHSDLLWEYKVVMGSLTVSFISAVLNGFFVGPRSTAIMFKKHQLEKDISDKLALEENPEYRSLKKEFGKTHGISALLNIIGLGGCCYILYWMSLLIHELAKRQAA